HRSANSCGDLAPAARLWLSQRLGVTPDSALLAQADLETWEEVTQRDAQRSLQSGNPKGALELLRERRERTAASALCRVEGGALRSRGNNWAAREGARRGIDAAAVAGSGEVDPNGRRC